MLRPNILHRLRGIGEKALIQNLSNYITASPSKGVRLSI